MHLTAEPPTLLSSVERTRTGDVTGGQSLTKPGPERRQQRLSLAGDASRYLPRRGERTYPIRCKRCVRPLKLPLTRVSGGRHVYARKVSGPAISHTGALWISDSTRMLRSRRRTRARSALVSLGVGGFDGGRQGSAVADGVSVGESPGPYVARGGSRCAARAARPALGRGCGRLRASRRVRAGGAGSLALRRLCERGVAGWYFSEVDVVEGADHAQSVGQRFGGVKGDLQRNFSSRKYSGPGGETARRNA